MSKTYAVVQDTSLPLGQIRDRTTSSIVDSVLAIKRHAVLRDNWLKSLECLYLATDDEEPSGKRRRMANGSVASASPELLRRRYLDPVSDAENGRDYVAVSYTWPTPEEEDETEAETMGSYRVESRKAGEPAELSNVRDEVWERVLNFAYHMDCENIWIDRECIDQQDETEQEAAMQSMHLVYSLSKRPVALLTRAIETVQELDLLTSILCGVVAAEDERPALELLDDITSNRWWTRAWTFQEDYRASTRMTLLIPHCRTLERRKRVARDFSDRPLFGNVEGELSIKSVDFRRQATEFCLYHRKRSEHKDICDRILKAAAKYNVLLKEEYSPGLHSISRSMSPTIFADIGRRGIKIESDRLAIAANCCGYTTRLDTKSLNRSGSSLSLSMLALYLLNGEIIENDPKPNRGTLNDTIFTYLSKQSLSSFRPPVDEELTFIKGCRLVDPQLTTQGTQTRGHLWKLYKVIREGPMKRQKYNTLTPLQTLATKLHYNRYGPSYTDLAVDIMTWVHEYPPVIDRGRRRAWGWRHWMASEIEQALLEGKALRLGCLVHPKYGAEDGPYRAVFVGESADDWPDERLASYAFTCSRPARNMSGTVQKHVSLEVAVEWPEPESRCPPRLYTKRWLNGLCFSDGSPQRPVLFPWPPALLA
ncbi:heterokaryon incompatibility protein-domain-containing protein [Xylariaceae sp. FL0662B]|nr:heterokaryon incompatibility protein-domain-containing protein [Xylariaceae sp. FL0662B]